MQEERIVGLRPIDQPIHGAQDVLLGGLQHRIRLVVREDDHVLPLVVVALHQEVGHVLGIVDAAPERRARPDVVDADEQRLALSGTVTVLECIPLWRSVSELLCSLRQSGCAWPAWRTVAGLLIGVGRLVLVLLRRGAAITEALLGRVVLLWRRIVLVLLLLVVLRWSLGVAIALLGRGRAPMSLGRRRRPLLVIPATTTRAVTLAWICHVYSCLWECVNAVEARMYSSLVGGIN